jgi:hypothetical protein
MLPDVTANGIPQCRRIKLDNMIAYRTLSLMAAGRHYYLFAGAENCGAGWHRL